ncbi:MAG: hydrogenase maturation protease [Anaerolineales bacterium]|nr:hydrogenase maturation protease [Anaerolineales bacterium]
MKTLILGLGNPFLTDDGVGVLVAQKLRNELPKSSNIDIDEVSIGGLTLMESMIGYERVFLVDAMYGESTNPGEFRRLCLDELRKISPTQHSASPHDASLITALDTGSRMGFPLPEDIIIYAIDVENIHDFSEEPTPAVAAAIPIVAAAIKEEINR